MIDSLTDSSLVLSASNLVIGENRCQDILVEADFYSQQIYDSSLAILFLFVVSFISLCYFERKAISLLCYFFQVFISAILKEVFLLFRSNPMFTSFSALGESLITDTIIKKITYFFLLCLFAVVVGQSTETILLRKRKSRNIDEISLEYVAGLEKKYQELLHFKHDYKNILISMEAFFREKDYKQLESYYYNQIQQDIQQQEPLAFNFSELSSIQNLEIKGLLYTKMTLAKTIGAEVSLEVDKEIELEHNVIIIRALGIILDNSIEAIEELGFGKLEIAFMKLEHEIIILVRNPCLEDLPPLYQLEQEGFSTKGENRGLGLASLKELFRHTSILIETENHSGFFTQKLILPKFGGH